MSEQISAGDRVRLKTGGPMMTVEKVDRNTGKLRCAWFDDKNALQQAMFHREALEPAPADDRD